MKEFMKAHGHPTYDSALCALLALAPGRPGEQPARSHGRGAKAREEKTANRHQPLSYAYVHSSPETLVYLTGLHLGALSWLVPKLEKKVGGSLCMGGFLALPRSKRTRGAWAIPLGN